MHNMLFYNQHENTVDSKLYKIIVIHHKSNKKAIDTQINQPPPRHNMEQNCSDFIRMALLLKTHLYDLMYYNFKTSSFQCRG